MFFQQRLMGELCPKNSFHSCWLFIEFFIHTSQDFLFQVLSSQSLQLAFERLDIPIDFILFRRLHDDFEHKMVKIGMLISRFHCCERFSRKVKIFLPSNICYNIDMLVLHWIMVFEPFLFSLRICWTDLWLIILSEWPNLFRNQLCILIQ